MPIVGEIDVTEIINNLGDKSHGLKPAGPEVNTAQQTQDFVFRATWGAVDMSTRTQLAVNDKPVWDVNGYYRALGIVWPFRPTRVDLRRGYLDHDGHKSEYLTYVMKSLLDPETRKKYDSMPLGRRFRDKYTLEAEQQKLSQMASNLSEERGTLVTVNDLLDEAEVSRPAWERPSSPRPDTWDWGYYLLNSRKEDYEDLIQWQMFLIQVFSALKRWEIISIGFMGETNKDFMIKEYGGKIIYFLNEDISPSLGLAEAAASQYIPVTEGSK